MEVGTATRPPWLILTKAGHLICPPRLLTLYIYPTCTPKCLSPFDVDNIHPEGLPNFSPSSAAAAAISGVLFARCPGPQPHPYPAPTSEHTALLVSMPRSSVARGFGTLGCRHRHRCRAPSSSPSPSPTPRGAP
jgi:hypothetical protein